MSVELRKLYRNFKGFRRKLIISVTSLVIGGCFIAITVCGLLLEQKWEQARYAGKLLRLAHSIERESNQLLAHLNSFSFPACSQENLVEMRKSLFRSLHIKDIGFFQRPHLVCTTGLGLIDPPLVEPPPDFVKANGDEVWTNRKLIFFNEEYSALVVRRADYNLVFDPGSIEDVNNSSYFWQLTYQLGGQHFYYMGVKELPNQYQYSPNPVTYRCSPSNKLCITVGYRGKGLSWLNSGELGLLLLSFVLAVALTYVSFSNLIRRRLGLKYRVRSAIQNNAFQCVYQPIVELKGGQVVGVEMLARLTDQHGVIRPDQFIPIVTKLNASWLFTQQIIEKSLAELKRLDSIDEHFKVSFNIFPSDINSSEILQIQEFQGMVDFKGKVVLEITENEILDSKSAQQKLSQLVEQGLDIAIDDFGTGYSNLNQLKRISSQLLKVDRSFVTEIEDESIKSTLIEHIVQIAHENGMSVVAEGIENRVQHQILTKMGVEYGQGWAFGKPIPITELYEELIQ